MKATATQIENLKVAMVEEHMNHRWGSKKFYSLFKEAQSLMSDEELKAFCKEVDDAIKAKKQAA